MPSSEGFFIRWQHERSTRFRSQVHGNLEEPLQAETCGPSEDFMQQSFRGGVDASLDNRLQLGPQRVGHRHLLRASQTKKKNGRGETSVHEKKEDAHES